MHADTVGCEPVPSRYSLPSELRQSSSYVGPLLRRSAVQGARLRAHNWRSLVLRQGGTRRPCRSGHRPSSAIQAFHTEDQS